MIIPGINCRNYEEAAAAAKKISEFSEWAHLDVTDGVFTPIVTWNNLEEFGHLAEELPMLRFEVHLMVNEPEKTVESWLKAGAERVVIHQEVMSNPHAIANRDKVMLAVGPGTSAEVLIPYFDSFSGFQVLAVPPGPSGQKFDEKALEKIKFLRTRAPNAIIEVDGGINPETAELAKEAGAGVLVSTSYIMDSPDPKGAYEELKRT